MVYQIKRHSSTSSACSPPTQQHRHTWSCIEACGTWCAAPVVRPCRSSGTPAPQRAWRRPTTASACLPGSWKRTQTRASGGRRTRRRRPRPPSALPELLGALAERGSPCRLLMQPASLSAVELDRAQAAHTMLAVARGLTHPSAAPLLQPADSLPEQKDLCWPCHASQLQPLPLMAWQPQAIGLPTQSYHAA